MIKKSLHFIVCYALIFLLTSYALPSCTVTNEEYFSFLDENSTYSAKIQLGEEEVGGCIIDIKKGEESITRVKIDMTYPSATNGTCITYENAPLSYEHSGKDLPTESIPELWIRICKLFSYPQSVINTQIKDGIAHTEAILFDGTYATYKTDKDGDLIEVTSGEITLIIEGKEVLNNE